MTDLSEARRFEKLITFRDIFNRLGQITWSVRQAEQRFALGNPETEQSLLIQYQSLFKKFIDLAHETEEEGAK